MEPALGRPYCGVGEHALAKLGEECKWRHAPVTLSHQMAFPQANISALQINQIMEQVAALWSGVCGIDLKFQPGGNANIQAVAAYMDGPNGILGESYLPCGNVTQTTVLGQRYDTAESWTLSFLLRVMLHEVGHALGLSHANPGTGAVMEPYLTAFATPQRWDIDQMVGRYGPNVPIVVTPPPVEPTNVDLFRGQQFDVPSNTVLNISEGGAYLFSFRRTLKANRIKVTLTKR